MENKIKLNENENKVLKQLAENDEIALYFRSFDGLDIKQARRACRSLARKGLAEFHRGLFNDDGQVAGSGYGITEKGKAFVSPCDICGQYACYDYYVDEDGRMITPTKWADAHDDSLKVIRRIRECDEHYNQSAVRTGIRK